MLLETIESSFSMIILSNKSFEKGSLFTKSSIDIRLVTWKQSFRLNLLYKILGVFTFYIIQKDKIVI